MEGRTEDGGASPSVVVSLVEALAFAADGGVGEFAKDVEDAGVGARLRSELVFEDDGVEVGEQGIHSGDGDAKAGGIEGGPVTLLDDVGGEVEAEAHFFEPGLVVQPVLVAVGVPAREIVDVESCPRWASFLTTWE